MNRGGSMMVNGKEDHEERERRNVDDYTLWGGMVVKRK